MDAQGQIYKIGDLYLNPNDNSIMLIINCSLIGKLINCYLSNHSYHGNPIQKNWVIIETDIKINE